MKKILFMLSLLVSSFSQAALIGIELDQDNYEVNDTISGQIIVSDVDETLGWFWTTLNYQAADLALVDWSFGTGFDNGETSAENLAGTLYLEEQTWSFDESLLASLQGNSFILASFSFKALTAGLISLSFDEAESGLLNFDFAPVTAQFSGTSFTVSDDSSTSVPEPASFLLFAGALALIRTQRKSN